METSAVGMPSQLLFFKCFANIAGGIEEPFATLIASFWVTAKPDNDDLHKANEVAQGIPGVTVEGTGIPPSAGLEQSQILLASSYDQLLRTAISVRFSFSAHAVRPLSSRLLLLPKPLQAFLYFSAAVALGARMLPLASFVRSTPVKVTTARSCLQPAFVIFPRDRYWSLYLVQRNCSRTFFRTSYQWKLKDIRKAILK